MAVYHVFDFIIRSLPSIVPSVGKSNTDNHSLVDIANEFILGYDHRKQVFGARFTLTFHVKLFSGNILHKVFTYLLFK